MQKNCPTHGRLSAVPLQNGWFIPCQRERTGERPKIRSSSAIVMAIRIANCQNSRLPSTSRQDRKFDMSNRYTAIKGATMRGCHLVRHAIRNNAVPSTSRPARNAQKASIRGRSEPNILIAKTDTAEEDGCVKGGSNPITAR